MSPPRPVGILGAFFWLALRAATTEEEEPSRARQQRRVCCVGVETNVCGGRRRRRGAQQGRCADAARGGTGLTSWEWSPARLHTQLCQERLCCRFRLLHEMSVYSQHVRSTSLYPTETGRKKGESFKIEGRGNK
eukprot:313172-Rhodomonas_salina.2